MKKVVLMLLMLCAVCNVAWSLEVREGVMTTAVEDRAPVDDVEVFPAADGQLYCFTKITGASGPTEIVHLWYSGEELVSRVVLPVRSESWRTWSTKQFLPGWRGEWRVEIRDSQGTLLKTLRFKLV